MKMIKLTVAGTIGAAFSPAMAADLPMRSAAPAPVFTAAGFSWAGGYVGLNAGIVAHRASFAGNAPPTVPGTWGYAWTNNSQSAFGALVGGQVGYNFQSGAMVYGAEADIAWTSAKSNNPYSFAAPTVGSQRVGITGLGTARLRVGYAFDRALIYATGGLAFGKLRESIQADSPTRVPPYSWSRSGGWKLGYTVGAGVEVALNHNWSVKAEGLYYNLGRKNHTSSVVNVDTYSYGARVKSDGFIARLGLNYRFGGPASPVLARY